MKIDLRMTSLDDLDWVIPLVRAYHDFEDVCMTAKERVKSVRELVSNANYGGIWGIYHDAIPVGYLALCIGFSIEFGGPDAFIDEFYLHFFFVYIPGVEIQIQIEIEIGIGTEIDG